MSIFEWSPSRPRGAADEHAGEFPSEGDDDKLRAFRPVSLTQEGTLSGDAAARLGNIRLRLPKAAHIARQYGTGLNVRDELAEVQVFSGASATPGTRTITSAMRREESEVALRAPAISPGTGVTRAQRREVEMQRRISTFCSRCTA